MLQELVLKLQEAWLWFLGLPALVQIAIFITIGILGLLWLYRPKTQLEKDFRKIYGRFGWYRRGRELLGRLQNNTSWWKKGDQVCLPVEMAMELRDSKGSWRLSYDEVKVVLTHLGGMTGHPSKVSAVKEEEMDAIINIADDNLKRQIDPIYGVFRGVEDVAREFVDTARASWRNPSQQWIMVVAVVAVIGIGLTLLSVLGANFLALAGDRSSNTVSQQANYAPFPATALPETPYKPPLPAGTPRAEKGPLLPETEDYIVSTVFNSLYSYVGGGQVVIENEQGQAQLLEVDGALYILVQGLASKRYCPPGSTETDHKKCVQAELRSYVDSVQKHLDYLVEEEVEKYNFSDDFALKLDLAKKMGQVVKDCASIYDIYVQCGKPGDEDSNTCRERYKDMVDLQTKIDEILVGLSEQIVTNDPQGYFKDEDGKLLSVKERMFREAGLRINADHPLAEALKLREWQTPLPPEGTPGTLFPNATPSPGQTPLPTAAVVSGNGDVERILKGLSEKVKKTVVMIGFIEEPRSETEPGSEAGATAFRIDAEGHLITNYHVVDEEGGLLSIRLPNGTKKYTKSTLPIRFYGEDKERTATLIAYDSEHDVALLKLNEPVGSDYLELGDSGSVQKGQIVFAVGYPFLSEQQINYRTVTNPSVKPELIDMNGNKYYGEYNMIEVDVTLNPGNSGGPLLDINGKVLGVNSLIKLKSGKRTVFEGIGYALPVDPWVKDLIQNYQGGG